MDEETIVVVVQRVVTEMRRLDAEDEFHISRKDFYDQFHRVQRLLGMWDGAWIVIGRVMLGLIFSVVLAAVAVVASWKYGGGGPVCGK